MKYLVAFLLVTTRLYGQDAKRCQIINAILRYKPAAAPYKFERFVGNPIIFVDTAMFFSDCNFDSSYGRTVHVSHDKELTKGGISNYIIWVHQISRRNVKVTVYYKYSNNVHSHFFLKRKGTKYFVTKFDEGYL